MGVHGKEPKFNKRAVMKAAKGDMPFGLGVPKQVGSSIRDRQRSWVLAGLKHLKAPAVTDISLRNVFVFMMLGSDPPYRNGYSVKIGENRSPVKLLLKFIGVTAPQGYLHLVCIALCSAWA